VPETTAQAKVLDQSNWYGQKARFNRAVYVTMKIIQIVLAAAIPVVSVFATASVQRGASATLGALIGVIEGILSLGQYQQNWLLYRAARQALRREELLFSGSAGPYGLGGSNATQLFVERADAIMSGETARWITSHQQPSKS
jgi:hypothetical protein